MGRTTPRNAADTTTEPKKSRTRRAAAEPQVPTLSGQMVADLLKMMLATKDKGPEHDALIAAIQGQQAATAEMASQFKRQQRISLSEHDEASPFAFDLRCAYCRAHAIHPANGKVGHPKPKLKFQTFFCYSKQREDQMTPLEIELCNTFTETRTARKGTWTATIDKDGNADRLMILVPFKGMDARYDLPPFSQILAELLFGEEVANPVNQTAIISQLHQQIRDLEVQLGVARQAPQSAAAGA